MIKVLINIMQYKQRILYLISVILSVDFTLQEERIQRFSLDSQIESLIVISGDVIFGDKRGRIFKLNSNLRELHALLPTLKNRTHKDEKSSLIFLATITQETIFVCLRNTLAFCELLNKNDFSVQAVTKAFRMFEKTSEMSYVVTEFIGQRHICFANSFNNVTNAVTSFLPVISCRNVNPGSEFMTIPKSDSGLKSSEAALRLIASFDSRLSIKYIHGFDRGIYSYFVSIQRREFGAKKAVYIDRFCNLEISLLKSMIEIPLECIAEKHLLNSVCAVSSLTYKKPMNSPRLTGNTKMFVLLLMSENECQQASKYIVVFDVDDINLAIQKSYMACYKDGNIKRGLEHFKPNEYCIGKNWIDDTGDFCTPENGLPYPIEGSVPAQCTRRIEIPRIGGKVMNAVEIAGSFVIGIGTLTGELYVIILDKNFIEVENFTWKLSNSSIDKDLYIIEKEFSVYTSSNNTIYSVKFSSCFSHVTSTSCESNDACFWENKLKRCLTKAPPVTSNSSVKDNFHDQKSIMTPPLYLLNGNKTNDVKACIQESHHLTAAALLVQNVTCTINEKSFNVSLNNDGCFTCPVNISDTKNNLEANDVKWRSGPYNNENEQTVNKTVIDECEQYTDCQSCVQSSCSFCYGNDVCRLSCDPKTTLYVSSKDSASCLTSIDHPLTVFSNKFNKSILKLPVSVGNLSNCSCCFQLSDSKFYTCVPVSEGNSCGAFDFSNYGRFILICNSVPIYITEWKNSSKSITEHVNSKEMVNDNLAMKSHVNYIKNVYPKILPAGGGTSLEFELNEPIDLSTNALNVYIGPYECAPFKFLSANRISCTTPFMEGLSSARIRIWDGRNEIFSHMKLSIKDPKLFGVSPNTAIRAGGAIINIYGEDLTAGKDVQALIGPHSCTILSVNRTCMTCRTEKMSPRSNYPLRVIFDKRTSFVKYDAFHVTPDPIILNVTPHSSFMSGGREVHVVGAYFEAVQNAFIRFQMRNTGKLFDVPLNKEKVDDRRFIFKFFTVPVKSDLPMLVMNGTLHMDNLIYPLSMDFVYFADPRNVCASFVIEQKDELSLELNMSSISHAANKNDIRITWNCHWCQVYHFTNNVILCRRTPEQQHSLNINEDCNETVNDGVILHIGNLKYHLQQYHERSSKRRLLVSLFACSLTLLITLVLLLTVCLKFHKEKHLKQTRMYSSCLYEDVCDNTVYSTLPNDFTSAYSGKTSVDLFRRLLREKIRTTTGLLHIPLKKKNTSAILSSLELFYQLFLRFDFMLIYLLSLRDVGNETIYFVTVFILNRDWSIHMQTFSKAFLLFNLESSKNEKTLKSSDIFEPVICSVFYLEWFKRTPKIQSSLRMMLRTIYLLECNVLNSSLFQTATNTKYHIDVEFDGKLYSFALSRPLKLKQLKSKIIEELNRPANVLLFRNSNSQCEEDFELFMFSKDGEQIRFDDLVQQTEHSELCCHTFSNSFCSFMQLIEKSKKRQSYYEGIKTTDYQQQPKLQVYYTLQNCPCYFKTTIKHTKYETDLINACCHPTIITDSLIFFGLLLIQSGLNVDTELTSNSIHIQVQRLIGECLSRILLDCCSLLAIKETELTLQMFHSAAKFIRKKLCQSETFMLGPEFCTRISNCWNQINSLSKEQCVSLLNAEVTNTKAFKVQSDAKLAELFYDSLWIVYFFCETNIQQLKFHETATHSNVCAEFMKIRTLLSEATSNDK